MLAIEELDETIWANKACSSASKSASRLVNQNGSPIIDDHFEGLKRLVANSFAKLSFKQHLCHGIAHA